MNGVCIDPDGNAQVLSNHNQTSDRYVEPQQLQLDSAQLIAWYVPKNCSAHSKEDLVQVLPESQMRNEFVSAAEF